jgi:hypothetical protein
LNLEPGKDVHESLTPGREQPRPEPDPSKRVNATLFLRPFGQMQSDDFNHPVGGGAGREEADVCPAFVDQIDERGVVDHVVGATGRVPGAIDLVGEGGPADFFGAAGQADQPRVEQRYVVGEVRSGVALGISTPQRSSPANG